MHSIDTLFIVNDSINLSLINDTLVLKCINVNQVSNRDIIDILKTLIPIISTLIGVILGLFINVFIENRKEYKLSLSNFTNELLDYSKGTENYNKLIVSYSKLKRKKKKQFRPLTTIEKTEPSEKQKIIKTLISLI